MAINWKNPENMRSNLLVTFGCRAGQMAAAGFIDIPDGVAGEDMLAEAAIHTVDAWITDGPEDVSFDEYIETALAARFPKED